MAVRQRVSVAEYLSIDEGRKPYLEYVDGEVLAKAMPNMDHGLLVQLLARVIGLFADTYGGVCGPEIRVQYTATTYRLADFAYWAPGRPRRGPIAALPPTLSVEVRSPGERIADVREKCEFYRAHGVDVAWLVDPDSRTVEVFEAGRDGELLGAGAVLTSTALPGFELAIDGLFAVLDS